MNAPHKIDISKGQNISTVSQQWFGRPDDQRFLSLSDMRQQIDLWTEASKAQSVLPHSFKAFADDENGLEVRIGSGLKVAPTHYGFGQLAQLASAPSAYMRSLPAKLAADCLNHGFKTQEPLFERSAYVMGEGAEAVLRCITSPSYGRILDRDVVDTVMKVAGNGTGDTHWKVPGVMDWANMTYNPNVDVNKDNTTLYASDRDVFIFLVDDMHPIEVGKLANGDPDLMFRGWYVWNSEVGARTFGLATMYLRGVCMNRNLWGVEGFSETSFRHTAGAPDRFLKEAAPALETYATGGEAKLIAGVKAAKAAIVTPGGDDDANSARIGYLKTLGFSVKRAEELVLTAICEEGRPPESVWDHAQAITAFARKQTHQDARLEMEKIGGKLLDKVTA